jgi:uncharacterized membrane protein
VVATVINLLALTVTGTNGGVSFGGLVVSLLGGLTVGGAYYIAVSQCVDSSSLLAAPPQWPLLVAGAMAGLLGSLLDSVLGATLQFSGECASDTARGLILNFIRKKNH